MPRKNSLKEVKGFGSTAKGKKEGIFAYSDEWEAGALLEGEEDEEVIELYGEEFDDDVDDDIEEDE